MCSQHVLEVFHLDALLRVRGTGQTVRPPRHVDVGVIELDAREVTGGPTTLCPRRRRCGSGLTVTAR